MLALPSSPLPHTHTHTLIDRHLWTKPTHPAFRLRLRPRLVQRVLHEVLHPRCRPRLAVRITTNAWVGAGGWEGKDQSHHTAQSCRHFQEEGEDIYIRACHQIAVKIKAITGSVRAKIGCCLIIVLMWRARLTLPLSLPACNPHHGRKTHRNLAASPAAASAQAASSPACPSRVFMGTTDGTNNA